MKEFFHLSKKEKEKIREKIKRILRKREEITFGYFHGSFLERDDIAFQDIDIALYIKPSQTKGDLFDYCLELSTGIEKTLRLPIDVRILNIAPFYFQNNVFKNGQLIFSRDEKLRTDLIEKSSFESMINFEYSRESLKELISK